MDAVSDTSSVNIEDANVAGDGGGGRIAIGERNDNDNDDCIDVDDANDDGDDKEKDREEEETKETEESNDDKAEGEEEAGYNSSAMILMTTMICHHYSHKIGTHHNHHSCKLASIEAIGLVWVGTEGACQLQ